MLKKNALSEMISLLFVLVHYCRWGLLPITRCAKCPSIQKTFVLMFFFAKCSHFTRDSPLSEIFLNSHFQHFIYNLKVEFFKDYLLLPSHFQCKKFLFLSTFRGQKNCKILSTQLQNDTLSANSIVQHYYISKLVIYIPFYRNEIIKNIS